MTSLFKETKLYIDNLFKDEWCETKIHYGGEEFNHKEEDVTKWVNPFYQPMSGRINDYCGTTLNQGNLHVVCWADTDVDALGLADNIIAFINTNIDTTLYHVRNFEIGDHGWNESNQVYIIVTFSIEALAR